MFSVTIVWAEDNRDICSVPVGQSECSFLVKGFPDFLEKLKIVISACSECKVFY